MVVEEMQGNSRSWLGFVKISFVLSVLAVIAGIVMMPIDLVMKGYMAVSALFLVNSTITLSKTLRDEHESERLINKISEAKTRKIIKEFSDD
jgi:hypothetical protein